MLISVHPEIENFRTELLSLNSEVDFWHVNVSN